MAVINGDFVQLVSCTSTENDGVLTRQQNGQLAASGTIYPSGSSASMTDFAFFHYHCTGSCHKKKHTPYSDNGHLLILVSPTSSSSSGTEFLCPVKGGQTRLTVVAVADDMRTLTLKEIDLSQSSPTAQERWCLQPLSMSSANPVQRAYVEVEDKETNVKRKVYMAAKSSGQVFATTDDKKDDWPGVGLHNPQTYFYAYRKYYVKEDDSGPLSGRHDNCSCGSSSCCKTS